MDIINFFETYGVVAYGIAILFGGLAGIKYLPSKWETKYRFLAFSMLVAVVFVVLEIFVQKNFNASAATKYLLTFCVVAVSYQLILKKYFVKWGWVEDDVISRQSLDNEGDEEGIGSNPNTPPPPPPGVKP